MTTSTFAPPPLEIAGFTNYGSRVDAISSTTLFLTGDEEEEQTVDADCSNEYVAYFNCVEAHTSSHEGVYSSWCPICVGYRDYAKKLEGDLAEANKRADALAVKLEQSEEARKKVEKDAAAIEDLRKRLHDAETSLSNNISQQSREAEILARLESQTRRFIRRTHQEYEIEGPEGDELLDALTLVEIHGDEARDGLENAEASLLKLFPYFFPKKEIPNTFVELAKAFNEPEDLGLKLRQEGLKIGVEGTVALIANSQQNVDWAKVGDIGDGDEEMAISN
ncbi:hypothetical protein QYE76_064674 [Lolium multiflorum]|uniref:Uncharacterized protein n=1 Tax=Lolium multiflorum TaxID=4521 RepID=A0AAD8S7U9_LOLMU|nr:hypothetical protein QYE76_064674 [Lolium multiflorum]